MLLSSKCPGGKEEEGEESKGTVNAKKRDLTKDGEGRHFPLWEQRNLKTAKRVLEKKGGREPVIRQNCLSGLRGRRRETEERTKKKTENCPTPATGGRYAAYRVPTLQRKRKDIK